MNNIPADLANSLATESVNISKKYKILPQQVIIHFKEKIAKNPTLLQKLSKPGEFKKFIKNAKKDIYYDLRQYRDPAQITAENKILEEIAVLNANSPELTNLFKKLTAMHVSTSERTLYLEAFNMQLYSLIPNPNQIHTILDVGGGVYPLTFPFDYFENVKEYIWVDKDKQAQKVVDVFAKKMGIPITTLCKDISQITWPKNIDLCIMLKTVPVVWRQNSENINVLAQIQAKQILITGNKEALTKRENIEKRENTVISKFIGLTGKEIVGKLDVHNEFGYVLA